MLCPATIYFGTPLHNYVDLLELVLTLKQEVA